MLKIYTDENVEIVIAEGLKRRKIKAWSAHDVGNLGLIDEQQLKYAVSKKACLFTYDADFFRINNNWAKQEKEHYGIFYVHPLNMTIGECIRKLKEYAELYEQEEVKNQILFL